MTTRIQINKTEPDAYKGMFALENYLTQSTLKKSHIHLIKLRASQINQCAFCINMHTKEALKDGESIQRIALLNAWKESNLFTSEEKAILQITEEATLIHVNGVTEDTYQQTIELFGPNYFSQIIMAIATINAWNRIAISTLMPVEP
ncbi:carboxymuconolactone decarboxylase family protein [Tenacibaculum sp. TC6]|uniref:carboxymuconolactone decarboxylase family protein n=1 Tax=Tenacibaculum sp. TC6 TaxID=3423223 RepID=UPI003D35E26E